MGTKDWSVRLRTPLTPADQYGATGFGSEEFARDVFKSLREVVRQHGRGRVELFCGDQLVDEFELTGDEVVKA